MKKHVPMPPIDRAKYALLPDTCKTSVDRTQKLMARIWNAPQPTIEMQRIEDEAGHARGCTAKSLQRIYYRMRASGSWLPMIDCTACRGAIKCHECKYVGKARLPAELIERFRELCERNQRKCRPAWRALIREWQQAYRAKQPFHGYPIAPPPGESGVYPDGMSYANMMKFAPTKAQLTAARIGRAAASALMPKVFTTRVGLRVGQFYVFDDLEHDLKVNLLGVNRRAMRPLELAALDLFSGSKFAWGARPCLENELEQKKEKLKAHEMRFLIAAAMCLYGYLPTGTTLLGEHATACIQDDVRRVLFDGSEGKITVDDSGIQGAPAFAGVFEGRSKGNFRFKAALESHHNLVHNETAALPGQMGKDRDHCPEELHGRDRYNERLIAAAATLPEERAALLQFPFMEWTRFYRTLCEIYDLIDCRTDHNLEGWEEAGLVVQEYRLSRDALDWHPARQILALPPHEQAVLRAHIAQPTLSRIRKLSPREVWNIGRGALIKLPMYLVPQLLGREHGVERPLGKDGLFSFEDQELGPGTKRFEGIITGIDGSRRELTDGETYLTYINPFAPDQLFVADARDRYLGYAERYTKVSKSDLDALHRAMGRAKHLEAERLLPLARRGAALTRAKTEMHRHNDRVLSGAPVTPKERALASAMKHFESADLLAEPELQPECNEAEDPLSAESLL